MDVKPVETELSMRRRSKEEERSQAAMRAPGSPALVLAISGGAWVEKLQDSNRPIFLLKALEAVCWWDKRHDGWVIVIGRGENGEQLEIQETCFARWLGSFRNIQNFFNIKRILCITRH